MVHWLTEESRAPCSCLAEFDEACFVSDVPIGELQGPIKTQFGLHLVKVAERTDT